MDTYTNLLTEYNSQMLERGEKRIEEAMQLVPSWSRSIWSFKEEIGIYNNSLCKQAEYIVRTIACGLDVDKNLAKSYDKP